MILDENNILCYSYYQKDGVRMIKKRTKFQPKGNSYDGSTEYTEKKNHSLIVIGIILLIILITAFIFFKLSKEKKCKNVEKLILNQAESYAKNKKLLPTIEGDSITIDIDDIFKDETLKPIIKESTCSGTIKFTKYKDEYIKTYDITNCDYCSTENRYKNWSNETNKRPSKKTLTDVIPYYNYYELNFYHSAWSNWISEDEIGKTDETYQIALPLKQEIIPKIPVEGKIIKYEKEDAIWYSYRDKQWRYYKDNGGTYSNLSSEQPAGFANKDSSTEMKTAWTEWSLDYPEKKSYRTISSSTGYRWYYLDENEKVYWNSGAYTPEQPSKEYDKKEKETVTMYRYQDKMWKWYNGNKRFYTGFVSVSNAPGYTNRDDDLFIYGNYSSYSDQNNLNDSNSWYREQKMKTYSRYRISYSMRSFLKFDTYVSKEEFEKALNMTTSEIAKREDIEIDIQYKFKYRKK